MSPHVGFISISARTEAKLHEKHDGLTCQEVREAMQWPATPDFRWDEDPEHGRRLVGLGTTGEGRQIIAWLLPVDLTDGTWTLKTARYL